MKKRLVKILCSLFAAVSLLSPFSALAIEFGGAPEVVSSSAIVFNLETEEILYSKNADDRLDPASFTKLMTSLLAYEHREKNGNMPVTITEAMLTEKGGSQMRLKVGEEVYFDDLLAGLVVQNANDAALALAHVMGGSEAGFVELMNKKAKELGMKNTYFANPTGVDSATMYTTLSDVLILCKKLYRINDFMLLAEKESVSIPATNLSRARSYTNKNALIPFSYVLDYYTPGVRGMVAGYTPRAGYCVATVREKKNSKNLVIVSGGIDQSEFGNGTDISSYRDATNLLNWAEESFAVQEIICAEKVICERKVRLASGVDHMILVTGSSLKKLIPVGADLEKEIRTEVKTDKKTYKAPIIEGRKYGEMDVYYNGEKIGTVPLVARSNIGLSRWLVALDAIKGFFSQGPAKVVLILVISLAVLYVLYLVREVLVQYHRENKARKEAIKEMMEIEKKRVQKLRKEEWKQTQVTMRKMRNALQVGFQVLQGDLDDPVPSSKRKAPSKAVAKVPEKYRTHKSLPQGNVTPVKKAPAGQKNAPSGQRRVERAGETYRVSRPASRSAQGQTQRKRSTQSSDPRRKNK